MNYLLFTISALSAALSSAFIKLYRKRIDDTEVKDNLYYISMILVALLFFGISSGFRLVPNLPTLIFAVVYALIVYISSTLNMNAIEYAELVTVSIFSNSGTILWSALWGTVFFKEALTLNRILGLLAILGAIALPYLTEKKTDKGNLKGLFYCLGIFFVNGLSNLVLKIYATSENVKDESVFFFYTNLILIPFILLIIAKRSSLKKVFKNISRVDKTSLLFVVLGMAFCAVISIVGIFLISTVDLVVYSVAEKALSTIAVAIVSFIFFKEKFTPTKIISFLLLISAVVAMGI